MTTQYTSEQDTIRQNMIDYMQNPDNWAGGTPKVTDFNSGSVIYTMFSAVATAVDTITLAIYMARQAAYISTATGTDLDNKAADYGVTRKPVVAASGTFTFTRLTPSISPTDIPAGTLVSTLPDASGNVITFATNADASLPAGQVSVQVTATAQTSGSGGNLAANTPLVVSSATPGIDGVTLGADIDNGMDVETDDLLRARTLAVFASLARGTAAWYQKTALDVTGIQSATVISQNRGAGTVDVFIVGQDNTIPDAALQAAVQAAIDAGRPITDDAREQVPTALTVDAALQIHLLPGYDPPAAIAAVQAAVAKYINNLGAGAGDIGYVYASQLVAAAMGVGGVVNATTAFVDTAVTVGQLPQAGTITVTAV